MHRTLSKLHPVAPFVLASSSKTVQIAKSVVLTKIEPDADFVPCFYAKQRCSTKEHSSKYFPKFIFVFF